MVTIRRAVMFLALALLAADAWSQDVGRVQFVSGRVEIERGTQRLPLQTGSQVQQGDVVLTAADGHVQLVMADSAFVSVRPNSRMRIDNYQFDASKPGAGRALLSLITGALHAFTGEIVARDRDGFKMKTPLATVGIRGSGNILAHLEETGTINHTLTGAHSVTSLDGFGIERTLVSYPGQTVQVRPGQPPRFIPTPAFIMASASPAVKAESAASEKPAQGAQTPAAGSGEAAPAAASASSSSPASAEPSPASASTTSTGPTTTGTTATEGGPLSATPPAVTGSSATVGTSQATAATVGASIATAQPPANSAYETVVRFFSPISGAGFEGVLGQSAFAETGGAVLDVAGRLVQIQEGIVGTFLAGPGQVPAGYTPATYTGAVTFSGGEHHDGFRSPDSSVILGRWTGGTVSVGDGARTFDLGPRSVSYDVITPTIAGVLGSFTGSSTFSLAGATTPTDAAGNAGSVTSASINANFSARTVSGNFGLAINGQTFSLAGTSDLAPGSAQFAFASALQNLSIACSGNCSTLGYLGTMNGQFAGTAGQWIGVSYRVNPVRVPNSGFSDYVVGNIALISNAAPTIGIVLPQSGTASLSFTAADPARSVSNYPQASGPPAISGSVQANFTSQTASFTARVTGESCGCSLPTFTASASNVPIIGALFSASTDAQRPSGVGSMAVACTGTGCGDAGSVFGRFDGLFRNSAGTSGVATLVVGDSEGSYDVTAGFGAGTAARAFLVAADGRNAMSRLATTSAGAMPIATIRGVSPGVMGRSRLP